MSGEKCETCDGAGWVAISVAVCCGNPTPHGGMTLRDYFAGQARIAMGDWTPDHERPVMMTWREGDTNESYSERCRAWGQESSRLAREARAAWVYAEADAMIEERSKP